MHRARFDQLGRWKWAGFGLCGVLLLLGSGRGDFDPRDSVSWAMPAPDLYDVATFGKSVWAVGYWGTVLHSSDSGRSWSYQPTPVKKTLFAVSFADARHGWSVGDDGVLLRTRDGGASWQIQTATIQDEFGDTRVLDADLFGVAAISPQEAWVVGDFGVILHTVDGEHWQQVRIPDEVFGDGFLPERILNGVDFTDSRSGWIAGEFGTTLRTTDGGETWSNQKELTGAIPDIYLFDVAGHGNGSAVAGAVGGVAIATRDGGASWAALEVPSSAGLFGVAWRPPQGFLVGDRGVILFTEDAGATWSKPSKPAGFQWLRGAAYGNRYAFAVGERGLVLRSSDGGRTWTPSLGGDPSVSQAPSPSEAHHSEPSETGSTSPSASGAEE